MNFISYFRSLVARVLRGSEISDEMTRNCARTSRTARTIWKRGWPGAGRGGAAAARIEFGGRERYKEESYEALGGNFFHSLVGDVRFALRVLRKSPGFTIAAVVTLALAIGANSVVFAVLDGLFIRPLNVPHSQDLYSLQRGKDTYIIQSYPDYLDLRDRNRSFDGLAAYNISEVAFGYRQESSLGLGL